MPQPHTATLVRRRIDPVGDPGDAPALGPPWARAMGEIPERDLEAGTRVMRAVGDLFDDL